MALPGTRHTIKSGRRVLEYTQALKRSLRGPQIPSSVRAQLIFSGVALSSKRGVQVNGQRCKAVSRAACSLGH